VVSEDDYERWLDEQRADAETRADAEAGDEGAGS
jgi:hypothetical protein